MTVVQRKFGTAEIGLRFAGAALRHTLVCVSRVAQRASERSERIESI